MVLKKIHHLIRYFFILGIIAFVGYVRNFQQEIFLGLMGPSLYIAYSIRDLITSKLVPLPKTDTVNYFFFLLPVCLVYFSFIGFQLKQLWNERGFIRWIILIVFIGFIGGIHYLSFQKLTGYLSA